MSWKRLEAADQGLYSSSINENYAILFEYYSKRVDEDTDPIHK